MLYATVHLVSKHNMMYILRLDLSHLTAAWVPGLCKVSLISLETSLEGVPAGPQKIHVTLEACKRIATSGLLCSMPGVEMVKS